MIEVDDGNFKEKVIEQSRELPIVIDFWASWCVPCRILSPILEKLEKDYKRKFLLAKINVDKNPISSELHKIMSIPNVMMFKNGKVVDEFIGALSEPLVRKWLDKNLS